jgi:hypothetical protein
MGSLPGALASGRERLGERGDVECGDVEQLTAARRYGGGWGKMCGWELIESVVVWIATRLEGDDAATAAVRGATTTTSPGAVTAPTWRRGTWRGANEADTRARARGGEL